MKISPAQIENYINRIQNEKLAGCLIYGHDEALINYRFDIIAKKITPDLTDPFLVTNISKERLAEDKSLIVDEFFSISMFGGRKLIMVKDVDNNVSAGIKALIEISDFAKKSDNFILILGGDLDKSSALRKIFEDSPAFAALACYEDNDFVIKKFITDELLKNNIKAKPEVTQFLFEKFGKNRQIILAELQKIITFLNEKTELTLEVASSLTNLESEISANEFVMNFASKKFDVALKQAEKLFADGFEAVALTRFLSNYLQKLYSAKLELERGGSDFEEVIKSQKLFFKVEAEFRKHLKLLSLDFLIKNLSSLEKLELKLKNSFLSPKLVFVGFVQDNLGNN